MNIQSSNFHQTLLLPGERETKLVPARPIPEGCEGFRGWGASLSAPQSLDQTAMPGARRGEREGRAGRLSFPGRPPDLLREEARLREPWQLGLEQPGTSPLALEGKAMGMSLYHPSCSPELFPGPCGSASTGAINQSKKPPPLLLHCLQRPFPPPTPSWLLQWPASLISGLDLFLLVLRKGWAFCGGNGSRANWVSSWIILWNH